MNDFFRGLEGLHEGTVKMETGHLNLLEGGSERLDEHGSTSLERSDKKLESLLLHFWTSGTPNRTPLYLRISESDRASAIPGEKWMCQYRLPARYGQSGILP